MNVCVCVFFFFCVCVCVLFFCVCVCACFCVRLCFSISLSLSFSLASLSLSVYIYIYILFIYLFICLFIYLFIQCMYMYKKPSTAVYKDSTHCPGPSRFQGYERVSELYAQFLFRSILPIASLCCIFGFNIWGLGFRAWLVNCIGCLPYSWQLVNQI